MTKAKTYFTNADPEDIEILEVTEIIVSGASSIGSVTSNTITATTLGVGTTNPQYNLDVVGDINFSGSLVRNGTTFVPQYSNTSGISTYAQSAGISTVASNLTGTPNINVGIITASSLVTPGSTAVYAGINTSTIDSDSISVHYMTFDTTNSAVNISNFNSGKKTELIIRNTDFGSRNVIIRTSTTSSSHQAVPTIVHSGGTITNGTVSIPAGSGRHINIFNVNGTVVGAY